MRLISAHIIVGKVEREKQKEVGVKFKYNNYRGRNIKQVEIPVFYRVTGYNIDLFWGMLSFIIKELEALYLNESFVF